MISKGLYDQNHEVHIVPTNGIVAAEEVHTQVINYINTTYESSYIGDDWYSISAVDVGGIRDKAKAYNSRFYFVKINGEICRFVPYAAAADADADDNPIKKKRNGNVSD